MICLFVVLKPIVISRSSCRCKQRLFEIKLWCQSQMSRTGQAPGEGKGGEVGRSENGNGGHKTMNAIHLNFIRIDVMPSCYSMPQLRTRK